MNLNEEEKLTIKEWLKVTNDLGYFLTKPRIVYETKSWKSVIEFVGLMLCLAMLLGGTMGGAMFGAKYFDCEVNREH